VKKNSGTLHIISLGCPKNQIDSEVMGGLARRAGMTLIDRPDDADTIIINTCSFIRSATEESLEVILTLAEAKKKTRSGQKLVVAGCLAQRYGRELTHDIPEADLVIGTSEVGNIVRHLMSNKRGSVITKPDFLMNAAHDRLLPAGSATAYLKISEGCSNHCSYCVIPSLRGEARSRRPQDICREAENLVARGIREIILVGQDTAAYGRDLKTRPGLPDLISGLDSISKLRWIRILYTHPAHLSADIVEAMARHKKVCPYIDLPVQHIDDTILASMRRRVTADGIKSVIELVRRIMPDAALRTSLIVGFPGESQNRFARLVDFVRETRFDHLGVFTYSPEEGTPAAAKPSRISQREKERRRDLIMGEQAAISYELNRGLIGSAQEVLIEANSENKDYPFIGRTRRQAPEIDGVTHVKGTDTKPGRFVRTKITGADHYDLYAEIV
jgi:ribosomal protein S12 methylthiotransferase